MDGLSRTYCRCRHAGTAPRHARACLGGGVRQLTDSRAAGRPEAPPGGSTFLVQHHPPSVSGRTAPPHLRRGVPAKLPSCPEASGQERWRLAPGWLEPEAPKCTTPRGRPDPSPHPRGRTVVRACEAGRARQPTGAAGLTDRRERPERPLAGRGPAPQGTRSGGLSILKRYERSQDVIENIGSVRFKRPLRARGKAHCGC